MHPIGSLKPSRGNRLDARVHPDPALATTPGDAAAVTLRRSERSFLARIKRWFGLRDMRAAAPASLLSRLRPPSTGRVSFFFGRLSRLSQTQLNLVRDRHEKLRSTAPGAAPGAADPVAVPASLLPCLRSQARRKPEALFDAVCGLWTGPGAAPLQQEVQAFLRSGDSCDKPLLALRKALLEANPGQSTAQADARANALYAALVGSVAHHAPAYLPVDEVAQAGAVTSVHPLDALARRLDALGQVPASLQNLLERAQALAGIQVGLDALAADDDLAGHRASLQARCQAFQAAQQTELANGLGTNRAAFSALKLADAAGRAEIERASMDRLRTVMATYRAWSDPQVQRACEEHAASLQEALDAVAGSAGVLAHYESLQEPDSAAPGKNRQPCAPLAGFLRTQTVDRYRHVQDRIDRLCAMAEPADRDDFLVALGTGVLSAKAQVQPVLVDDLFDGKPDAVKGILPGAQWDGLAGAIRLAAIDRREQAALSREADAKARAALIADHGKERFATEIINRRRELNAEINRLVALNDPGRRFELLGDAGAMAGASESAIAEIRRVAGDLVPKVDVLLVNWIYCSCLDPATLDIDQPRVLALWKCLQGDQAPLPGLENAQALLEQGFRSFHAMRDVHQRIAAFSKLLADAQALAAASHVQDPKVRAQGMVAELHARLTGQAGVDPADPAFTQLLAQRIDAARQAWTTAGGATAAKLIDAAGRRDALVRKLQGLGWKFDLRPDGRLRSTIEGSSVSQHEQLRRLSQCLGIVAFIQQEGSRQTPESRLRVAELVAQDYQPLAAQLKHFDPVARRLRPGIGDAPELGQMMRLVDHRVDIEALVNASDDVARLSAQFSQQLAQSAPLEAVVEGAMRIAVLQHAIDNDSADFRMPAKGSAVMPVDGVLKRLQAFGLGLADPIPAVARQMQDLEHHLLRQPLDMTTLCKRLDPVNPGAAGVVQSRIPGAPAFGPGAKGMVARARAYVKAGEMRRQLDNQHAVAQRFARLDAGQSFDIHLGRAGQVTLGTPVAPGVGVGVGLSASLSNGIRISRTGEKAFEVDVVSTRSGRFAATLSVLSGAVEASGQRSANAARGYRIRCSSREEALELVEALVGARKLDAGRWTTGQVQALQSAAAENRAAVQAQVTIPAKGDASLVRLEAGLDKSAGQAAELAEAPFLRVERSTQTRAWNAKAGADVLDGQWTGEVERGAQVSVTRTCVRRGALLRGEPVLASQSRVVAGQVEACLRRLMPQLAGEALAHYVVQVEQACADAGEAGQTVDVELESVMTHQGVRRANHFYRLGDNDEAEREMREPANYAVRGLAVVLKSESEDTGSVELPVKETARVGGEIRRALAPFAGQS